MKTRVYTEESNNIFCPSCHKMIDINNGKAVMTKSDMDKGEITIKCRRCREGQIIIKAK